ncbi:MAG: 30S ribosomal protein S8 [Candidatus Daviesbacteria bacterium]|nr:30S ribosomal protein S8 [Candidatus Daviesbacteria bacterium]
MLGNCLESESRVGKMDNVGDLLIRIKNGYMASKKEVLAPYSKLSKSICELLIAEGYIQSCKIDGNSMKIILKYENRKPVLTDVTRISKPGKRVYRGSKFIPRVYDGLGIAIVSTPKGVMTDKQARFQKVGGEVMAYVW